MHNASRILFGTTRSNIRTVDSKPGTVAAGMAAFLKSDNTYSATESDGPIAGFSMGSDLSKAGHNPVCRAGLGVPVQVTTGFTPTVGAAVFVVKATGKVGASDSSNTIAINAVYSSGVLDGILEDGSIVRAALIDMVGGV